jgi:hypothetical protein
MSGNAWMHAARFSNLQDGFGEVSHTQCSLEMANSPLDGRHKKWMTPLGTTNHATEALHLDGISNRSPGAMCPDDGDIARRNARHLGQLLVRLALRDRQNRLVIGNCRKITGYRGYDVLAGDKDARLGGALGSQGGN